MPKSKQPETDGISSQSPSRSPKASKVKKRTGGNGNAPSTDEIKEYKKLKSVIQGGMRAIAKNVWDVAGAIKIVRDKKLYRNEYGTFEAFLDAQYEIGRQYGYFLMNAQRIREILSTMDDNLLLPPTERQIRPLARFKDDPEKLHEIWSRAVLSAGGHAPTESQVREAVAESSEDNNPGDDDTGDTPAEDAGPEAEIAVRAHDWLKPILTTLEEKGFSEVFEQPIAWGAAEADLHSPETGEYVKFIEELYLETLEGAMILAKSVKSVKFIADAPDSVVLPKVGDYLEDSFTPAFNILAKELGLKIAFEGMLYEPGELNAQCQVTWQRVNTDATKPATTQPATAPGQEADLESGFAGTEDPEELANAPITPLETQSKTSSKGTKPDEKPQN
jgi:hypothetical protein